METELCLNKRLVGFIYNSMLSSAASSAASGQSETADEERNIANVHAPDTHRAVTAHDASAEESESTEGTPLRRAV